jgi:hypothetical protein
MLAPKTAHSVQKEKRQPLLGIKIQSIHHPDHSLAIILTGLQRTGLFVSPFCPQAVSSPACHTGQTAIHIGGVC